MHKFLLYAGYGYLAVSGVLHFLVDVVAHHFHHQRAAGPETAMYNGLHSAYALGQVVFGLIAILIIRSGSDLMSRQIGQAIGFFAVAGWLAISLKFIEYTPPKFNISVVLALLIAAAFTK